MKSFEAAIVSYECGDNCYLAVRDAQGSIQTGLCTARACDLWNQAASMPSSFVGKKVTIQVGNGQRVDGAGEFVDEIDAFEEIRFK